MPGSPWDEPGPRLISQPAVAVLIPVVLSLAVQLPVALALTLGTTSTQDALAAAAVAAASALALLGAWRWPGPTLALVAALTVLDVFVPPTGVGPFLALGFAIVIAIIQDARVWVWAAVPTGWLVALVGGSLAGIAWNPVRVALATVALVACVAIGQGIRVRRRLIAAESARLAESRRVTEHEERERLAGALHDALVHTLAQISLQSRLGTQQFDRHPEDARDALARIRTLSATGLDEVRGVLSFLRGGDAGAPATAPLVTLPQLSQLPALVSDRSTLGLTVALDDGLRGELPSGLIQTSAYRIVQEALANVVRHSAAAHATVTLERDAAASRDLIVTVSDDGIGVPRDVLERSGLRGMRDRAALVGGTVEILPSPRSGTVVRARLPWESPA